MIASLKPKQVGRPDSVPSPFVYVGVDPGASGGIAALYSDHDVRFKSIPATDEGILEILKGYLIPGGLKATAVIEWVNPAFFGTAKASMSKLYGSFTKLRMALTAVEIPYKEVKPSVWQRELGIPHRRKSESKTDWKQRLKGEAEDRFPELKITLATSDALLIAYYCRMMHEYPSEE